MSFIPFSKPYIGEQEIEEVVTCLKSGWLTTGPKAKEFEASFGSFIGMPAQNCVSVNSATSGLHLALEALGVGRGDEVILPAYTFTATAEIVRYLGAIPVFVDCDDATFNVTAAGIQSAITSATKAIIVVHFAGLACDMQPILTLARKHGLSVIEDAAHALPSKYNGQLIGSLDSDATVFSFYANKTMTTGEGGMLVSPRADVIERARVMRLHGINKDVFGRYQSDKPAWAYEVVAPGFKYNLPDILAAIGVKQLDRLPALHSRRCEIATIYLDELHSLPLRLPAYNNDVDLHAWHLFPVRVMSTKISRDKVIEKLFKEGVGCSVHFIPLHHHPYWRENFHNSNSDLTNTDRIYSEEVSIPLYPGMTDEDVYYVITALKKVFNEA